MTAEVASLRELVDCSVPPDDFRADVLDGLSEPQKRLPAKYFYDERGSQLFDRICELPEYYPTRTEMGLLEQHRGEIAQLVGPGAVLVELGSGSSTKVRLLLDALERPAAYVGLDISREHLLASTRQLSEAYPELPVIPVCADYTRRVELPSELPARGRLGFFPGSTVGNFTPPEAKRFLAEAVRTIGAGGAMLIGVDLLKDTRTLHAAYNDAAGVTAAFNLNVLERINRELGADFDLEAFEHRAVYNADRGCMEMQLVSRRDQSVQVSGRTFRFSRGEHIHTEDSHKYRLDRFATLAREAGWLPTRTWVDPDGLFSLCYLRVAAC